MPKAVFQARVLLVGLCTKWRPWSNSFITAKLILLLLASALVENHVRAFFKWFQDDFAGSSFCTFGRVMYKKKTLVKFVDNRKSCCSLFLLWSRITFEPFSSDFKTILTGSLFLGLRASFCTHPLERFGPRPNKDTTRFFKRCQKLKDFRTSWCPSITGRSPPPPPCPPHGLNQRYSQLL